MAMAESGIKVADGGVSLGRTFGAKRLKALLFLAQHPEIDETGFGGKAELHFAPGSHSVKGAVHPMATEIAA